MNLRNCSNISQLQKVVSPCTIKNLDYLKTMKFYPIIYVGEIGTINDYKNLIIPTHNIQHEFISYNKQSEIYKYGVSTNIYRRVVNEHQKQFKYFDIKILRESHRYREIESIISKELKIRKFLLYMMKNNKIQREFMILPEENDKEWFNELVDHLVTSRYKFDNFISFRNL